MVIVMNNESTLCTLILVSLLSISPAQAVEPKDISKLLDERAMEMVGQSEESAEARIQSCNSDNTSVVTIYTTNGDAQVGIDVSIDGRIVGSMTSHYPDEGPSCNTDSSAGVVTLVFQPVSTRWMQKASTFSGQATLLKWEHVSAGCWRYRDESLEVKG